MDFKKETITNMTITSDFTTEEAKALMKRLCNECDSELDAVVAVSKKLMFDGSAINFSGRDIGDFHVECFLVVKHYENERWESREEYYVYETSKSTGREFMDDDFSGYNVYSKETNVQNANEHLEEFASKYSEPKDVYLPFWSIYSV